MNKIIIIGSSNTDLVIKLKRLPLPGETLFGDMFFMNPGGKGANQAVAAARLGGNIFFIGKIGADMFGGKAINTLRDENINIDYIVNDPVNPSGVAFILIDEFGENSIVVMPGSNFSLSTSDISEKVLDLNSSDLLLMQLEIPLETVCYAAEKAKNTGAKVILNPAPAAQLPDDLLNNLFLITPNETEAEYLTGVKVTDLASAEKSALIFKEKGVQNIIITLGASGAYVLSDSVSRIIPASPVKALDTTAAGDVFNGALVVGLSEGMDLIHATDFANKAAAISVTRLGAQSSAPFRTEIS